MAKSKRKKEIDRKKTTEVPLQSGRTEDGQMGVSIVTHHS